MSRVKQLKRWSLIMILMGSSVGLTDNFGLFYSWCFASVAGLTLRHTISPLDDT